MGRRTLLDLLGTERLPAAAEQQFIDFCLWYQVHPSFLQMLHTTGLKRHAERVACADRLDALVACARRAAEDAHRADLPVLALGALQGMVAEMEQIAQALHPDATDASAVSFHAARIVGWAAWARGEYGPAVIKASAEQVAYGEQIQALSGLLAAR